VKFSALTIISVELILLVIGAYFLRQRGVGISLDLISAAIFIALFTSGFIIWRNERKLTGIELGLIDYLSDLAEASKYSPNIARCVMEIPRGNYGEFNEYVEEMREQIGWGASLEEALENLKGKINSQFVSRVISTVIELNRTGGNVSEVLAYIARNSREAYLLNSEKYSQLSSYAVVVFVSFAVFLLAVAIIDIQFFPTMMRAAGSAPSYAGYLNTSAIPTVKIAFTGMTFVNGIGGGIMAGILRDGKLGRGLIYASILSAVGYIVLLAVGGV